MIKRYFTKNINSIENNFRISYFTILQDIKPKSIFLELKSYITSNERDIEYLKKSSNRLNKNVKQFLYSYLTSTKGKYLSNKFLTDINFAIDGISRNGKSFFQIDLTIFSNNLEIGVITQNDELKLELNNISTNLVSFLNNQNDFKFNLK